MGPTMEVSVLEFVLEGLSSSRTGKKSRKEVFDVRMPEFKYVCAQEDAYVSRHSGWYDAHLKSM